MRSLQRVRSSVKPTLRPTAATVVLFDATTPHRAPRSFGRGVLRYVPYSRPVASEEDSRWAATEFARTAEDRAYELAAGSASFHDSFAGGGNGYDSVLAGHMA